MPSLVDLCLAYVIENFRERPLLDQLPEKYQATVLDKLDVDLPLTITAGPLGAEGWVGV